ncbi:hypothetical protein MFLAVUS_005378 [Mucor flavus]|uniref:Uncharacterized protein n=1 Tax=Mucor flavus TaxID=439312 RepID=A0ABP9YYK6_9FUNG
MSTPSVNTIATQEDIATYLTSVADRLQSKVDEAIEEMTKRIDTLERNLKQMEPPATAIAEE